MELVAAMAVTAAVFAILFGVYRFTDKLYLKNLSFGNSTYTGIEFLKSLEKNLLNAKGVSSIGPHSLAIIKKNGLAGKYELQNGRIYYNQRPMTLDKIRVLEFEILALGQPQTDNSPEQDELVSSDANRDGILSDRELSGISAIRMRISLSNGKDSSSYSILSRVRAIPSSE